MSNYILDYNYEYCWREVESCASFNVRGYSDKIHIVEDYFYKTEVIAEFDIDSVSLDLEDLWIQMADVFDTHVDGGCHHRVDFRYLVYKLETIRYAEKHGADETLLRAMMSDTMSPDGEYWVWTDYEAVIDRMFGVMRGEVDTGRGPREDYANLNSYVQPISLVISDGMKASIIKQLSEHYDIADNKIYVKTDSSEDFCDI